MTTAVNKCEQCSWNANSRMTRLAGCALAGAPLSQSEDRSLSPRRAAKDRNDAATTGGRRWHHRRSPHQSGDTHGPAKPLASSPPSTEMVCPVM